MAESPSRRIAFFKAAQCTAATTGLAAARGTDPLEDTYGEWKARSGPMAG